MYYKVNITSGTLNLRKEADKSSDSIAMMKKGDVVVYNALGDSSNPDWTPVIYNGISGYASSVYLTIATTEEYEAYLKSQGQKTNNGGTPTNDTTNNNNDGGSNDGDKETTNGKGWFIAGCVTLAVGAILNLVL